MAAIEAARVGEAGKGFAVAADEIRSLADDSQGAAKNIIVLIQECIEAAENGVLIVNETAESLEQSVSLSQASKGENKIASLMQTSMELSEESAQASK